MYSDGLYKLEASDQILIVHSVHLYVIVSRNKYCLSQVYSGEILSFILLLFQFVAVRLVTKLNNMSLTLKDDKKK